MNCPPMEIIDNYVLNQLSEEESNEFEEHYFKCHSCFEEVKIRSDIKGAVKDMNNEWSNSSSQ